MAVLWSVLYVAIVLVPIIQGIRRGEKDANYYVAVISSFVIVFLPSLISWYLADKNLIAGSADMTAEIQASLTLHVAAIATGCVNIVLVFAITYIVRGATGTQVKPAHLAYESISFGVAFVTLFVGAVAPNWFVSPQAYKTHAVFSWIWPETINCPMNLARTVIGALLLLPLFTGGRQNKSAAAAI